MPSLKPSRSNKSRTEESNRHVVNAAKTLLANIRFMSVDQPYRTLAFTSTVPNEGKTFVVANLGSAIATSGKTCLLVECDMRRRSLANTLSVHAKHGLYAVMSGQSSLRGAVVRTRTPNLYFLDAEPHIPNPSDIIASKHFQRMMDEMSQAFDYVIFDTPPVGTFVDAAVLGSKVDAVFLVVRENYVHRDDCRAAAEQLCASGSNLVGAVMNFCEHHGSEYYDYYYYEHDGKRDDSNAPQMVSGAAGVTGDISAARDALRPVPAPAGKPVPAGRPAPAGKPAQAVPAAASPSYARPGTSTGRYQLQQRMGHTQDLLAQAGTQGSAGLGRSIPVRTVPRADEDL